jgi:hypothetical protein
MCDLLKHVDVTLFGSATLPSQQLESSLQIETAFRRTLSLPTQQHSDQKVMVINQESDIAQLLFGFKKILADALGLYVDKPESN